MAYSSTNACINLNQTTERVEGTIAGKVNDVKTNTDEIRATAEKIKEMILKFYESMKAGEEKQLAHENSIRVEQELKEQFGNYDAIRKTVMGVVRDFDINLVRNSTIQEMSEELWITSSRYWLSYALLAITAWVNDYKEVADSAVKECVRRNPQKAALFFCLMNLRFGRNDTARRWFKEYLKVLDPESMSQLDSILLQAYLSGLFGTARELESQANSVVQKWIRVLNGNPETQDRLVDMYYNYIANMPPAADCNYSALSDHSEAYPQIRISYQNVSKYERLIENVEGMNVELEEQTDENYKARVDKVLNDLISTFDEEEQKLIDEKKYYETIMLHNGNVEEAKVDYEEQQRVNANFNIGAQMIRWAVYSSSEEVNVHVRKFALQNTKEWYLKAVDKWNKRLQEELPLDYPLAIDVWKGVSNGRDGEMLETDMRNYYSQNKMSLCYFNTPNTAALIVAIAAIALAFVTLYSLIVAAGCIAFLAFRIIKASSDFPKRVNAAVDVLRACMIQLKDFRDYFDTEIQIKDRLVNDLNML